MESSEGKSKKRKIRVKKTRTKVIIPGVFTRSLGKIFGSAYLDNPRPINIGILVLISFLVALVSLLIISPPNIDFRMPPVPGQ